jgi:hypothetical protein
VAGDFCHLTVPSGRGIHRLHFGLGCSFLPRSAIPGIAPRSPSYTMAPDDQTSAQHDSLLRGRRSLTLLSRVHLPIYTPPISPLAHFPTNWLPSFPRFLLFPCRLSELILFPDGTHSLSSPSHRSLLFSKTFNVSIPLQHIPLDEYIFEHTSREDQPDLEDESDISDSEDEDRFGGLGGFGLGTVHEVGRWKSVKDGKLLGEGGKGVKFTVIG